MSPDPLAAISVRTAPLAARVAAGPFDEALDRYVARRVAAAREQGAKDARETLGIDLDGAVERLDAAREEAARRLAHTSVELAMEIARCLLRVEIPAGRYDLEAIVRDALAHSGVGRGRCVIHVHPTDAETLRDYPWRSGTEVEADPEVARGSVHVTTPQGLLVRDIDNALTAIRDRIQGDLS